MIILDYLKLLRRASKDLLHCICRPSATEETSMPLTIGLGEEQEEGEEDTEEKDEKDGCWLAASAV